MKVFFLCLILILTACTGSVPISETQNLSSETLVEPFVQATNASRDGQTPSTLQTAQFDNIVTESLLPESPIDTQTASPITSTSTPTPTLDFFPEELPYHSEVTASVMTNCLVTLPTGRSQPGGFYSDENLGNEDGTIFTELWSGGKVIFEPGGPGKVNDDGSLEMKWPWYRTIPGEVVIGGRRLDAPAPRMPEVVLRGKEDGYGETGFHPSVLVFPTEGCWEVTGSVGEAKLTFVTLIIKIPYKPLQPFWLPDGLILNDYDLVSLPEAIRLIFSASPKGGGEVSVETIQGLPEKREAYPNAPSQPVIVNGQPGICIEGAWDESGQWQSDAGAGTLEWSSEGFTYRISFTGLELNCQDLLRIAGASS